MRFIDEPTSVEIQIDENGLPLPRTFTWQDRRLAITGMGRRWEEEMTDGPTCHFLVMVAGGDRFELTHHAASGRWRIVRTWERSSLA